MVGNHVDTMYHLGMIGLKKTLKHHHRPDQPPYPAICVSDLSVRYGESVAVEGINFALNSNERMAVIGPNGAGKSSMFKAIVGLQPRHTGVVDLADGHVSHSKISYVPQHEDVDWRFPVTVYDVAMMGRARHIGYMLRPRRRDHAAVIDALHKVNMWDFRHRQIGQLSGGQRRRVFIARALAQSACVLIMDEPFAGVDKSTEDEIFEVLDTLRHEHVAVIIATHNLDRAATHYDRVLLVNHHQIAFGCAEDVYTVENMQHAFGGYRHVVAATQ